MTRILVAEDNKEMLGLLLMVLSGYTVDAVSSYDEAVALIRNSRDGWDVAVLDGSIPRQGDGQLLAAFLRQKFPGIKIISCSLSRQSWGDRNIHKPEEIVSGLPAAIREVLGRP